MVVGAVAALAVSLGAASFAAGGSEHAPGPTVRPEVDVYMMQHAVITGSVPPAQPATVRPSSGLHARAALVLCEAVNLIPRLMRGPAGRRAVIGAAVLGLLAVSLSAAEGGVGHLVHRQSARTAGKSAEAVPRRSGCSALAAGIRLLHQAVRAARRVSYQGVQVISWRAPGGSGAWLGSGASRVMVDVWHRARRRHAHPGGRALPHLVRRQPRPVQPAAGRNARPHPGADRPALHALHGAAGRDGLGRRAAGQDCRGVPRERQPGRPVLAGQRDQAAAAP